MEIKDFIVSCTPEELRDTLFNMGYNDPRKYSPFGFHVPKELETTSWGVCVPKDEPPFFPSIAYTKQGHLITARIENDPEFFKGNTIAYAIVNEKNMKKIIDNSKGIDISTKYIQKGTSLISGVTGALGLLAGGLSASTIGLPIAGAVSLTLATGGVTGTASYLLGKKAHNTTINNAEEIEEFRKQNYAIRTGDNALNHLMRTYIQSQTPM